MILKETMGKKAIEMMYPKCRGETEVTLECIKESNSSIGICKKCKAVWVAANVEGSTIIRKGWLQ